MACATISLKRGHEFDPLSPRRPKRRRCTPMTISPTAATPPKPVSVFKEATPHFSKEQLADSIRSEIKRLQHRRQLAAAHASASQSDSSGSDNELPSSTSSKPSGSGSSTHTQQQRRDSSGLPLFTFKQMTALCEKMVRDRTEQLCEQYDKVLSNKLSEQYEAFLKFNHDQIQKHFSHSSDASYLS